MLPILSDGEYLMISRLTYLRTSPERGDIVVFHHPVYANKDYVKRIVGLPREHLRIEDGRVFIDGAPLEEQYLRGGNHRADSYNMEWLMEEGQYFVMGDNRKDSQDSRSFWPIRKELIAGRVWLRYWPLRRWGAIKVMMPPEINPD